MARILTLSLVLAGAVALTGVAPVETDAVTSAPVVKKSKRAARVFIDAGHGALNNHGTEDAFCRNEEVHTKVTQDAVAAWLKAQPDTAVAVGRATDDKVSYRERMRAMNAWRADAVISIHSDARRAEEWWRDPASGCWRSRGGTGFAVLYSDEGSARLVAKRLALATATAEEMIAAGFVPYPGSDYPGLYDPVSPGVFVDRHTPKQRIMMLRRTTVPFVIVETHQAVDEAEATRWQQTETQEKFAAAIHRAVLRVVP